MARTPTFYIDRALAAYEAGFASEAARKRALEDLSYSYDLLKAGIMRFHLELLMEERTEEMHDLYWAMPSYIHNWTKKFGDWVLRVFPEAVNLVAEIETLVDFRLAIKAASIMPPRERQNDARVASIMKAIGDKVAARKAQYARGMAIHDLFGGLPVSATAHYVTNDKGTTFLRTFFYLGGRITALGVILAVLDAKKREAKG